MKKIFLLAATSACVLGANAQSWHEGDIQWFNAQSFGSYVNSWSQNHKILDEDDNFFIARVKPHVRFQNTATQVRENLQWGVNDKRLIAWLPINNNYDGNRNALPTGEYDSECFTMWSYIDHWGNWSAPLCGIPGGFTDVAHKNGVAVSGVASVPYGAITSAWSNALDAMGNLDAAKAAEMMVYYGSDGLGYNSEFSSYYNLSNLRDFHQLLLPQLNAKYAAVAPGYQMAENIWYDGTTNTGSISFDGGLAGHNYMNWGPLGQERSSLFFNYNWNMSDILSRSQQAAAGTYGGGRSPLYLYCGINMQGGEPQASRGKIWDNLANYNLSVGLWGAHSVNMFWESRGDLGSTPAAKQSTYQYRIENWFTGGTHNPVNDLAYTQRVTCSTTDTEFQGMSRFMSARSAMSWDLGDEPFYSYFNIGNGRFFNYEGERQNDSEWYNIGVQDYMPSWRWWFTTKFLGKSTSDVPANGMAAAFTWNDAWFGGSCLRVNGSTSDEYLHLFKTKYELKAGDVITVRSKLVAGRASTSLVMSVEGTEATVAKKINLFDVDQINDDQEWITTEYTVEPGDGLAGKTLAMIALQFENATNADIYLGEVSIKRGSYAAPVKPEITLAKVLRNTYAGVDGKIVFNVPNQIEGSGKVCYNSDVNISMFKLYAQEEGAEPVLMGTTTSWAGMYYSVPFNGDDSGHGNIRFGVSSLSLDMSTESEISWSEYKDATSRAYSDAITIDKSTVTTDESFTLSAVDSKRAFAWAIYKAGDRSAAVAQSGEQCHEWTCQGLADTGNYDLVITGPNNDNSSANATIEFTDYLSVSDPSHGRIPEIYTLTANGEDADIEVLKGDEITLQYTGRTANGSGSRGLHIDENFVGVANTEVFGQDDPGSFSVAGWLKVESYPGKVNWIDIVNRQYDSWPRNHWGWLWSTLNEDGTICQIDQDYTSANSGATRNLVQYDFSNGTDWRNGSTAFFTPGQWTHFAMVFDRDATKSNLKIYINGKLIANKWKYYTYLSDFEENPSRSTTQDGTTDDYLTAYKEMRPENYIVLGGTRHSGRYGAGNGFIGIVDDYQIWNKAMTADEVAQSYKGLDADNLPAGVAAYWDFETDADSDYKFAAKGSKAGAKLGAYIMGDSNGYENGAYHKYIEPVYSVGCPNVKGTNYKVETTPTWSVRRADVTEVTGSDTEGSAKATFSIPGEDYTAVLTLTNDLGSASRTFQFIKVGDPNAVDDIIANNLRTYTIDDVLYLEVDSEGEYAVTISAINGQTVAAKAQHVDAGDYMRLAINGASGVYVVNVMRNGKQAKAFKVIKK